MSDDQECTEAERADPAVRMRIEAMKILVLAIVEEAGDKGISVGELKRRLGITPEPDQKP
jgi:hypothetical protein